MSMEKLTQLKNGVNNLPERSQGFARSLLKQWDRYNRLSDKQWYWVEKLAGEAMGEQPAPPVAVEVGDFHKVLQLFKLAREHVKFPRITLQVGEQPIALSVAGPNARAPGTVNVTDGRPFGQNIWFGRVTPDGEWQVNMRAPETGLAAVEDFLLKFAAEPAKTAKEYGRLTGRCCFCNKALKDERSTAAGFGETCAKHYGLQAEWKASQPVLEVA